MPNPNPHLLILARELRGLTQAQLAESSGIDQGAISRYENGMKPISSEVIEVLAAALSFPVAFFCREYQPVPMLHIECKHGWVKLDGRLRDVP